MRKRKIVLTNKQQSSISVHLKEEKKMSSDHWQMVCVCKFSMKFHTISFNLSARSQTSASFLFKIFPFIRNWNFQCTVEPFLCLRHLNRVCTIKLKKKIVLTVSSNEISCEVRQWQMKKNTQTKTPKINRST